MTLVIVESVPAVQVLWVWLEAKSIPEAIGALAEREGTSPQYVGRWPVLESETYPYADTIGQWATEKKIEAVVWTALPCGMKGSRGVLPTLDELKAHFNNLDDATRAEAGKYISNAPAQIQTPLRHALEALLSKTVNTVTSPDFREFGP